MSAAYTVAVSLTLALWQGGDGEKTPNFCPSENRQKIFVQNLNAKFGAGTTVPTIF